MVDKLDKVKSFLETLRYSVIASQFVKFKVDDETNVAEVSQVSSLNTNKIFTSNPELIFVDTYSRRYEYLYTIEIDAENQDTLDKIFNNLVDNIESFNTRNTLYTIETDFEDNFDANAIDAAPSGWSITGGSGLELINIKSHLTHDKCLSMNLNSDDFSSCTVTKAITNTAKNYYILTLNRAYTKYDNLNMVGLDANAAYGSTKGYEKALGNSDTTWEKIEIRFDVTANTYEVFIDDVSDGSASYDSISATYVMLFNQANAGTSDGILYIDDVKLEYFEQYIRPTDMIFMKLFPQATQKYNPRTQSWNAKYKIRVQFSST